MLRMSNEQRLQLNKKKEGSDKKRETIRWSRKRRSQITKLSTFFTTRIAQARIISSEKTVTWPRFEASRSSVFIFMGKQFLHVWIIGAADKNELSKVTKIVIRKRNCSTKNNFRF